MSLSIRNFLFVPIICVFIFSTIFDPGDVVLGLKIPLFILSILVGVLICIRDPKRILIPKSLLNYILLFISIPLISIFVYYLKDGSDPFEGFTMLKGYLFIFLSIILVITKLDITKHLCNILLLMAFCIIFLFVFLLVYPEYFEILNNIGMQTQIFYPGKRSYDGIITFQQAYFACSPMLVIPIAYYYYDYKESNNNKLSSLFKLLICIIGLFLAGSRNNMFAALFLPIALFLIFNKKSFFSISIVISIVAVMLLVFANEFVSFLDPNEYSNQSKISYLADYFYIFSDLTNLFFGQGLGAYYKFAIFYEPYYITELTYFEVLRNFGIFSGSLMIFMLIYPIYLSFKLDNIPYLQKYLAVSYAFYLVMNFTNPNLFSSMGILILCLLLSGLYTKIEKKNSNLFIDV
jgi:hypothetical protein